MPGPCAARAGTTFLPSRLFVVIFHPKVAMNAYRMAALLLLTSLSVPAQDRPAQDLLVLSIRPVETMIKTGSDVAIWIKLTNDSTSTVDLSASWSDLTGVDPNYEYDIRDSRGNAVAHRIHSHPELGTGRAIFGDLPSGQSTEFSEDISRLVDIANPGIYTIQLRRSFSRFSNLRREYRDPIESDHSYRRGPQKGRHTT